MDSVRVHGVEVALPRADDRYPRIDLVVEGSREIRVVHGMPDPEPVVPPTPAGMTLLATIRIEPKSPDRDLPGPDQPDPQGVR